MTKPVEIRFARVTATGWWYTYPSEKYKKVTWYYYSQDMET